MDIKLIMLLKISNKKKTKNQSKIQKPKNMLDNMCKGVLLYMLSLIWRGGRVGLWHQS